MSENYIFQIKNIIDKLFVPNKRHFESKMHVTESWGCISRTLACLFLLSILSVDKIDFIPLLPISK